MEPPRRSQFQTTYRSCLICGGPTKTSHLGIDACRACSTFYRRTKDKNQPLICRTGTGRCTLDRDEGFSCKKCRYERFSEILEGSQADSPSTSRYVTSLVHKIRAEHPSTPSPLEEALHQQEQLDGVVKDETSPTLFPLPPRSAPLPPAPSCSIPSTSSTLFTPPPSKAAPSHPTIPRCPPISSFPSNHSLERKIMSRIRQSYSLLCLVRRTSELASRKTPVNPLQTASGDIPFIPATLTSLNQATRILVTALFDFASSAFDEFGSLESADKWLLVKNFTNSFSCIESFYRGNLIFPGKEQVCMAGYTAYVEFDDIESFFSDAPNPANAAQAKGLIDSFLKDNHKIFRDTVRRINPTEEEFLALIGLAFWNIDSIAASESLTAIAGKIRKELLHELHVLYKEEQRQSEYAGRLGDLFFFMMTYQTCLARMPEQYEYFRLLDLIDEDHLPYQMQKNQ